MTNTTQYFICASTYHGFDQHLLNNGDTIAITTAPLYTDEQQRTIRNDWGCAQYGPFSTLDEARAEMTRIYGPCREIENIDQQKWHTEAEWACPSDRYESTEPETHPEIVESYAVGEYEVLTENETKDAINLFPPAEATDKELREMADAIYDWLHSEGEHCDYVEIEEILVERRDRARALAED